MGYCQGDISGEEVSRENARSMMTLCSQLVKETSQNAELMRQNGREPSHNIPSLTLTSHQPSWPLILDVTWLQVVVACCMRWGR